MRSSPSLAQCCVSRQLPALRDASSRVFAGDGKRAIWLNVRRQLFLPIGLTHDFLLPGRRLLPQVNCYRAANVSPHKKPLLKLDLSGDCRFLYILANEGRFGTRDLDVGGCKD
jgi:hypothetical protein